ncbi:Conserved oligomeric Golgi complex subunit 1 [Frankliniella fusca]|uniref:Conserved oligomeric Golgi complex subunit 1 n=1 Tax=Frankliniella fusca TaxID=407009 RepID=A0AAE1LCM1_9NEOP|nr:Conserved oligomeric Golgi complex subunit 1 [Frankliniella fusca]
MVPSSMLDIDPDKLFEEKSISEIEIVQKKIQDEIERKKEELRTMVGERYRDLIEAADTISDMQQTATGVIDRINTMEKLCGAFQQRQLLGFQLDLSRASYSTLDKNDGVGIGLAVQVKILIAIPEQIWVAVEREDYLLGAQLFLLARHIKTGLHLESSFLLEQMMPVVSRQWSAISHFQEKLVNGALTALSSSNISAMSAARCLCVLSLLDNMNGEALLVRFLKVRENALTSVLLEGEDKANVKHRICSSLHLLLHTLSLLSSCFIDGRGGFQEGLIWQHLQVLTQEEYLGKSQNISCLSSLELLDTLGLEPTSLRLLPPVIRDFRPANKSCKDCVPLEEVQKHTSMWLQSLQTFLRDALNSLLELVTSIRALQGIRDAAIKEQQGLAGCDIALQKLQVSCGSDIWSAYYQPLVSARVCVLVEQQWANALSITRQKLADQLRAILRDKNHQPEHDLRWFVWKERLSDLPQQPVQSLSSVPSHGLLLKCQCYSPRVEAICQSLDNPLSTLLQELASYVQESDIDRNEIQQHLLNCSAEHLNEFCKHIKENCLSGATGREEACIALVARLPGALCDLSPALKSCFLPFSVVASSKTLLGSSAAWSEMIGVLQECSKQAWTVWQDLVSSHLDTALKEKLMPESGSLSAVLAHSTPQWEEHTMEEQGEEGGQLHSVIRVPAQPSLALQDVLSCACQILSAAQPHTITSDVKVTFVEKLVSAILGHYKNAVKLELPQAQCLQFLLDVMFLSSLLIPRSQKPLSQNAQQICQLLEKKIDPFDLDVFSPYVQANVRQSVRNMQCLLGSLIACWPEKLASMWTTSSNSDKSTDQPSMLAVCPPVPLFPLLPVVTPGNSGGAAGAPQQPPSQKTQARTYLMSSFFNFKKGKHSTGARSPKKKAEPIENIKSGAAAFFGAMSTDWFS